MSKMVKRSYVSDQFMGIPHPSETTTLFGQRKACEQFLEAFSADRLHHGWLLTGLRGIGKATLAWQIAKFLLTTPDPKKDPASLDTAEKRTNLNVDENHPTVRRIRSGSERGLLHIQCPYDEKRKRFKQVITVDEIRKLNSFFTLSAMDGGRRIVIVDSADDMNRNASNALLKILEEPPQNAYLFLISHNPAKLLPTIRSRCCEIQLEVLDQSDLTNALRTLEIIFEDSDMPAILELAGGSVGEAIKLINQNGLSIYRTVLEVLSSLPSLDLNKIISISEQFNHSDGGEKFVFFVSLLDLALKRLALSPLKRNAPQTVKILNEQIIFLRLCPDHRSAVKWATLTQEISTQLRKGHAVNLDPASLILDTFFKIEECANKIVR